MDGRSNARRIARSSRPRSQPARSALASTKRLYLRHLRLDSGGYDEGAAYWGHGEPLYWATNGAGVHVFRRAADRPSAKRIILQQFPAARFYR
jgi:hypothetical protein